MTRRQFSIALGGVAFPGLGSGDPAVITLHAIAGVHLPETLAITTASPGKFREGLWELRTYTGVAPTLQSRLAEVFQRSGIRPSLRKTDGSNLTYLIPFANLTARDRGWTQLNADPEWNRLRHQFLSYRFGLYRLERGRARSGS